jgi:hypothetical protein
LKIRALSLVTVIDALWQCILARIWLQHVLQHVLAALVL